MTLPALDSYQDLLKKYRYDYERYEADNNVYILLDCMLSLNAIPDWIMETADAFPPLKKLAEQKDKLLKDSSWAFDPSKVETDIDHQIKLIRMICNHSKHYKKNNKIPVIIRQFGATFPARFPIKFRDCIFIGENRYDAEDLINNVFHFWEDSINTLGVL